MQNTILGFLIMIISSMSVLEQVGLIDVLGPLTFLYAAVLTLFGLLMILRAQGKMAADKVEKRAKKEQEKVKKELAQEHEAKEKELAQEHENKEKDLQNQIEAKEKVVHLQEEVIDDMVNPKQGPQA